MYTVSNITRMPTYVCSFDDGQRDFTSELEKVSSKKWGRLPG
jgi:hypothetical protein